MIYNHDHDHDCDHDHDHDHDHNMWILWLWQHVKTLATTIAGINLRKIMSYSYVPFCPSEHFLLMATARGAKSLAQTIRWIAVDRIDGIEATKLLCITILSNWFYLSLVQCHGQSWDIHIHSNSASLIHHSPLNDILFHHLILISDDVQIGLEDAFASSGIFVVLFASLLPMHN